MIAGGGRGAERIEDEKERIGLSKERGVTQQI